MHTKIIASLLLSTFAFAAEQEEMGVTQISSKVSSLQLNEAESEPADSALTLVEDDEAESEPAHSSLNTAFIAEDEEDKETDNISVIDGDDPEALASDTEEN